MQVISSEETKTRNHLMDNIKGILMISVITAHYLRVGGSFQLSSFDGTVYILSLIHIYMLVLTKVKQYARKT